MQVDGEWNAEAVLLAPYDHLYAVTENTDVTGEDAVIVSAGATDIPISDDGSPDVSVINDPRNNWLLVGDPRLNDTDEIIHRKLQTALGAGCRVIICIAATTHDHIASRINVLASIDCSRIVIAFVHPDATTPSVAISAAQTIRDQIASIGATGRARFIVAGNISGKNAAEIIGINGVDGVLLMDDQYDDFGTILEVLEAVDQ